MPEKFDYIVADDYGAVSDINQILEAWEGVAGKGVPLRCTQVDSALLYAGDFTNIHANGFHFRVRNAAGQTIARAVSDGWLFGKNVEAETAVTFDGVDLDVHAHTGVEQHGAQLVTESYSNRSVTREKIGLDAVGEDEIGGGLFSLVSRQGGSAMAWTTPGSTDYTPANVRAQSGVCTVSLSATNTGSTAVVFGIPFTYSPQLFYARIQAAGLPSSRVFEVGISVLTQNGFTIQVNASASITENFIFTWLAIGEIA